MARVYEDLGVRPLINAASTQTRYGGVPLPREVVQADASTACVRMEELQEAAGRVIAEVTGAEAGYVTSGVAAGLTLAAAACPAGLDVARMDRLPDTTGMANEIIVQRAHRNAYDHAVRAAGALCLQRREHGTIPTTRLSRAPPARGDRRAEAWSIDRGGQA